MAWVSHAHMKARPLKPSTHTMYCLQVQQYLSHALGEGRLQRISSAIARPSLRTCLRANTLKITPQVSSWPHSMSAAAAVLHLQATEDGRILLMHKWW